MITIILAFMLSLTPWQERKYIEIAVTNQGVVIWEGKRNDPLIGDDGGKFATFSTALEYLDKKGFEVVCAYEFTGNSSLINNVTVILLKKKP